MAKHNKQEVSNNEEEGLTIEEFSKEAIKLIKELKAEKTHSNTPEEQVQGIKELGRKQPRKRSIRSQSSLAA